jgi:hypothetical protein
MVVADFKAVSSNFLGCERLQKEPQTFFGRVVGMNTFFKIFVGKSEDSKLTERPGIGDGTGVLTRS